MPEPNKITACFSILVFWLLQGCETGLAFREADTVTMQKLLKQKDVVTVPYHQNDSSIIILPVSTPYGIQHFLLDTGATRSAVFNDRQNPMITNAQSTGEANVFGLVNSGRYPLINIPQLKIGEKQFDNLSLALLPKQPIGLIGMDVMHGYNLLLDSNSNHLHFIPSKYPKPILGARWTPISLFKNPNSEVDRNLHFFNLRVGQHLIPAILDTGAAFNVINWDATIIPELKRLKRKLRKNWQIQGAVDAFDPVVKVKAKGTRAGRTKWKENQFIVMNFDHLDGLGFNDKPLVIAGMDIFKRRSFYINFTSDELWIEPSEGSIPEDQETVIDIPVLPATQGAPEVRN